MCKEYFIEKFLDFLERCKKLRKPIVRLNWNVDDIKWILNRKLSMEMEYYIIKRNRILKSREKNIL